MGVVGTRRTPYVAGGGKEEKNEVAESDGFREVWRCVDYVSIF